jgi:hypothetical protein
MKTKAAVLIAVLALAGCARTPRGPEDPDEERLRETMEAAETGPSTWSPAITIPLYPVLLVANTSIDVAKATYRWFSALFGGGDDAIPVPERIEKQAEKLPKN